MTLIFILETYLKVEIHIVPDNGPTYDGEDIDISLKNLGLQPSGYHRWTLDSEPESIHDKVGYGSKSSFRNDQIQVQYNQTYLFP